MIGHRQRGAFASRGALTSQTKGDGVWLSVVIAAYNAEATLGSAVDSLRLQSDSRIEVIIVDDGSTDATGEIADSLAHADSLIRVVHKPNGGTASALNAALSIASGEYVSRLDADDELESDYLSEMAQFVASHPDFDMYSHDLWRMRPGVRRDRLYGWDSIRSFRFRDVTEVNLISGPGTLVRRDVIERVGGYREGIYNEDYDLWLRALAGGARHIYCPKPLYRYRVGLPDQKTASLSRQYRSDIEILQDLIDGGALSPDDANAARVGIAQRRRLLWLLPVHRVTGWLHEKTGLRIGRRAAGGGTDG